jgi:DNA modification methylase
MPIADLRANPRNWRTHPDAQRKALAGVLREVGIVQSVIVNERTGLLVDGHARVEEAAKAGQLTLPVTVVDLSDAEEALILSTLDPVAAMAGADTAQLDALLRDVETGDAALQQMLSDLAEQHGVVPLPAPPADDPGADLDRVAELQQKWRTERGQVWEIGAHRLMCGDSREDLLTLMQGAVADCLWTDPPYGVNYVGKTKSARTIENDGSDGLLPLLEAAFRAADKATAESAPFYIAHPPGALCLTFGDAIRTVGWRLHQTLIWCKNSMVLGHSDYHYQHEPIYYGWTSGNGRAARGQAGGHWHGNDAQVSVFHVDRPSRSEDHPTMKPPELIVRCIENSTPVGGTILDLFAGSGSTLVAAEQTGRRGYGMEIDPGYCAVILERLAGMGLVPNLITTTTFSAV